MIHYLKKRFALHKIQRAYRTDVSGKCQSGLFKIYASHFKNLKHKKIKLLEIGVEHGGSMLLWSKYFTHPRTTLVGLDIKLPPVDFPKRISVYACDQNDADGLKAIAKKHGPFDIIVDDGAHLLKETENCFISLWEHVLPEGYYVIEDWSVGYIKRHFSGMSEIIARLIQNATDYGIREFWVHWDKKSSTAIFRKKGTEPEVVPSFIKGLV